MNAYQREGQVWTAFDLDTLEGYRQASDTIRELLSNTRKRQLASWTLSRASRRRIAALRRSSRG